MLVGTWLRDLVILVALVGAMVWWINGPGRRTLVVIPVVLHDNGVVEPLVPLWRIEPERGA